MARIPILDEGDPATPPDAMTYFQQVGKARGRLLNIYRAMANRPEAGRSFSALANTVYRGNTTLDPKHAELAYLTATVVNNCHYWIPTHTVLGRSLGLTEEQMSHLNEDPLPDGIYDDAQAAIIRYAQKSTRLEPIDDITYRALEKYFSVPQIMDICLTVGLSNMVNRFHATFLTDVDEVTIAEVEAGDAVAGICAIPRPKLPR
jgi:AhpD family alkylhydroperoxidase